MSKTNKEWLLPRVQEKVNYLERQRQVISKKDLPDRKDLVALLTGVIGIGGKAYPEVEYSRGGFVLNGRQSFDNYSSEVFGYRKHSATFKCIDKCIFPPYGERDALIHNNYID